MLKRSSITTFSLGGTPFDEDGLEIGADGPDDYRRAAVRYRDGLLRLYQPIIAQMRCTFSLEVVTVEHDLGPQYDVVARVIGSHPPAIRLAEFIVENTPANWADIENADPIQELP